MSDTYTVVVFKNYDKETNSDDIVYASEDKDIVLLSAGNKDDDAVVRTTAFAAGRYQDLTRAYMALGTKVNEEFNKALKEAKKK